MLKNLSSLVYLKYVIRRKDLDFFWALPLPRLTGDQIYAILKIVDAEVAKSFCSGLIITRQHVLKEKTAVLAALNVMGNLNLIPKEFERYGDRSFEAALGVLSRAVLHVMRDEIKFYFEKLSKKRTATRTMYNIHLETMCNSVMHAIYNGALPYTQAESKKHPNLMGVVFYHL